MQAHEIANIFPLIQGAEFDELVADIAKNGLVEPVVIYEGKILDGRNRYNACQKAGITPDTVTYDGNDPLGHVISLNLHRRHLSESQRGMVAARLANMPNHRPEKTANLRPLITQDEAASKLNVSERTVNTAKKVQQD